MRTVFFRVEYTAADKADNCPCAYLITGLIIVEERQTGIQRCEAVFVVNQDPCAEQFIIAAFEDNTVCNGLHVIAAICFQINGIVNAP